MNLLTMSNVSQELAALIMFTNLKYTLSTGKGSLWLLGQLKDLKNGGYRFDPHLS